MMCFVAHVQSSPKTPTSSKSRTSVTSKSKPAHSKDDAREPTARFVLLGKNSAKV